MISVLSIQSDKKIFACETPQKCAMSRAKIAPAAARSDAVRGCSAFTSPAARRDGVVAVHPGPSVWRELVLCACTPARFSTGNWDGHDCGRDGSGGAVTAATVLQPSCNRLSLVNQCVSLAVTELQRGASRHVRVRAYAGTRAYRGGEKSVTLQPSVYVSDIKGYVSYRAVAERLRLQPSFAPSAPIRGKSCDFNIIGGGYAAAVAGSASIWSIRGRAEGRGAKSFGAGSRGGAGGLGSVIGGSLSLDQGAQAVGQNGGNAGLWAGRSGHVQTAMFNRSAVGRGNAWVVVSRRKLGRVSMGGAGRGLGSVDGLQGEGGLEAGSRGGGPPSPRPSFPSSLAHAIFLKRIGSRSTHLNDGYAAVREGAQSLDRPTGSGEGASRSSRRAVAGRGVDADLGLRRSSHGSGRGSHVN